MIKTDKKEKKINKIHFNFPPAIESNISMIAIHYFILYIHCKNNLKEYY